MVEPEPRVATSYVVHVRPKKVKAGLTVTETEALVDPALTPSLDVYVPEIVAVPTLVAWKSRVHVPPESVHVVAAILLKSVNDPKLVVKATVPAGVPEPVTVAVHGAPGPMFIEGGHVIVVVVAVKA